MRKHLIHILTLITLMATSCVKEATDKTVDGPRIRLNVSIPSMNMKATRPGVDALNENLITSVYYYLYKEDELDSAPKVYGYFAGLNLDGKIEKSWDIPVSANTISNELFPVGSRTCRVFVVANPPTDLVSALQDEANLPTLNELRSAIFTTDLTGIQSSFVMVFDGEATLINRTADVASEITASLSRVADKLTVKAIIAESFTDPKTGFEWTPEPTGLRCTYVNGLRKSNLSGDFDLLNSIRGQIGLEDYFESAETNFEAAVTVDDHLEATIRAPFYTYPMTWEFADRFEPYFLFELPWSRETTDSNGRPKTLTQSCYYKLMLSTKSFGSNAWYHVVVNLKVLGSFFREEPTQQYLYEDYTVLDWNDAFNIHNDENNVDADIKEARYLVVNQTSYVLHDQNSVSIPFSSSHECSFEIISATKKNFNGSDYDYVSTAASWFNFNGSVLEFSHELNNTMGRTMDVAPYEIQIRISHSDDATFHEIINIKQYPAITIDAQRNSDTLCNRKGFVYVNNQQESGYSWNAARYYGGVTQLSASDISKGEANSNPNMYIIETNAIVGSDYIIGDSRSNTINNLGTWSDANAANTRALYIESGTTRSLLYYYPTSKDEAHKKYISPKFRIASSYGKTYQLSHENAERRCAAYQEDGYPAGRWRVPTESEITYIAQLSSYSLIPSLFSEGSAYWSATGTVTPLQGGGTNIGTGTSQSVRCVYDDWYWEVIDKANGWDKTREDRKTEFTWGDVPRQ